MAVYNIIISYTYNFYIWKNFFIKTFLQKKIYKFNEKNSNFYSKIHISKQASISRIKKLYKKVLKIFSKNDNYNG